MVRLASVRDGTDGIIVALRSAPAVAVGGIVRVGSGRVAVGRRVAVALGSMVRVGSGRCVAVRVGSGIVAVRVGSARVAVAVRVGSGIVAVRVGSALVAVRVGSARVAVRVGAGTVAVRVGSARVAVRVGTGTVAVRVGSARVAARVGTAAAVRVATGAALTRTDHAPEAALGPGFATVTFVHPLCTAVPVAVSCVGDWKMVGSATPFQRTSAPSTKRLPRTCNVNAPIGTVLGVTPVSQGTGLRSVTRQDAAESAFLRLVARTVTCDPGTPDVGAVYLPVASTKPTVASPPTTSSTLHTTAVLANPFT
jgi:hypothetical protein